MSKIAMKDWIFIILKKSQKSRRQLQYIISIIISSQNQMREEQKFPQIDILCIGQIKDDKSVFLHQYTKDSAKEKLTQEYNIYAKLNKDQIVYLHEIEQQETLYLERKYDGALFFVDLVDSWNVAANILRWVQLLSKFTSLNVYKIPIRILVTRVSNLGNDQKWRKSLQNQLLTIVESHQIIYFESFPQVQQQLQLYFRQIMDEKAKGIKSTTQNHIRLYGLTEIIKFFITNAKLTFFRFGQIYDKKIKRRFSFNVNFKINSRAFIDSFY